MAATTYQTIFLEGENPITREKIANAAIIPGHLIELMSTDKVRVHANAAQNAIPMFAIEDDLQGNDITDAYAAAARVKFVYPRRGDVIYALLADGQTASIGDFLESAGDGTLQVHAADIAESAEAQTIYTMPIVAQAIEAVDMSGSSGADPSTARIKVRVV
jgi:hypothetical protein